MMKFWLCQNIYFMKDLKRWKNEIDEDFHKAEQVNSNSQLYKQAGNAIVVDVLEAIFKQMF